MAYLFPFGQELYPLIQEDQSEKRVFVLGVYASAVHACWTRAGKVVCPALAVASEPRIFWDGNLKEAEQIIGRINIPAELGELKPAQQKFNGPSAKTLDEHVLAPLGFTRADAWLCDCLPETRLNPNQAKVIDEKYNPLIEQYVLNPVTIPKQPSVFCDKARAEEITEELMKSGADLLVTLGDAPIKQFIKKVANVDFSSLREYIDIYGYGKITEISINGKALKYLPLTHPRQIGELGKSSPFWTEQHKIWEEKLR